MNNIYWENATMEEIFIKIPKGMAEKIKHTVTTLDMTIICDAIKDGTPLPKGHGDLIDIEELKDMLCLEDNDFNRNNNVAELITLEDMDRIDVVIEADKEG